MIENSVVTKRWRHMMNGNCIIRVKTNRFLIGSVIKALPVHPHPLRRFHLNNSGRQHLALYQKTQTRHRAGNALAPVAEFRTAGFRTRPMFKWLNRRSQKASFTWESFQKKLSFGVLPAPPLPGNLKPIGWSPYARY